MDNKSIDASKGQVNQLCDAMDRLGGAMSAQGAALTGKMDTASAQVVKALYDSSGALVKTIDAATEASKQHAKSLVKATWALAGATLVLVLITVVHVYVAATHA